MNVESELVFIVNAAERTRSLLRDYIAAERLHVVACGSAAEYLSHPKRGRSACVLVSVAGGGGEHLEVLAARRGDVVLARRPHPPP